MSTRTLLLQVIRRFELIMNFLLVVSARLLSVLHVDIMIPFRLVNWVMKLFLLFYSTPVLFYPALTVIDDLPVS